jgi:ribosome-binding protein aMBF1 (putative translation factor)
MDVIDYLKRAEEIRKQKLISRIDLVREMDIAYNTLTRLEKAPCAYSLKTARKIKSYVEKWESTK